MKSLEAIVLTPDFIPLGPINQMTSIRWTQRFLSVGDFELWAPLTKQNGELLQKENLIWTGGEEVAVIEVILKSRDDDGSFRLQISGRFIESWLERRVVLDKYAETDYVSNHMRNIVYQNAVNPAIRNRRLPYITLSERQNTLGPTVSYSAGSQIKPNLLSELSGLATSHRLSPRFKCNVPEKVCEFAITTGIDRSIEQKSNPAIILSSDLSDILSSDYSLDISSSTNTAYIAGQGEDENRKTAIIGSETDGVYRRELYVDARDISDVEVWDKKVTTVAYILSRPQRTQDFEINTYSVKYVETKVLTHPETGETRTTTRAWVEVMESEPDLSPQVEEGTEEVPIPDAIYEGMLIERGKSKLSENVEVESFNCQIRVTGARAYTYGEDYFLGDRITVQDKELQIQISTEIEEVEQVWDESSYSIVLTLGNSAPTITQIIKKRG